LRGSFPPNLYRKGREYIKYSRLFLFCLDKKQLSQNGFAPQKESFLRKTRRTAQEYWTCIPSTGNDVWRGKIFFALPSADGLRLDNR